MERSIRGNFTYTVRASLVIFLILMFIFSLFSCESSRETAQSDRSRSAQFESERRILKEGLTFILRNIEHSLEKIDSQPKGDRKTMEMRANLLAERIAARKILDDLRAATTEDWAPVSAAARKVIEEFSFSGNQVSASHSMTN